MQKIASIVNLFIVIRALMKIKKNDRLTRHNYCLHVFLFHDTWKIINLHRPKIHFMTLAQCANFIHIRAWADYLWNSFFSNTAKLGYIHYSNVNCQDYPYLARIYLLYTTHWKKSTLAGCSFLTSGECMKKNYGQRSARCLLANLPMPDLKPE